MTERLERIERLKVLLDSGAISPAEFDREKGIILSSGQVALLAGWRLFFWIGMAALISAMITALVFMVLQVKPGEARRVAQPDADAGAAPPIPASKGAPDPAPVRQLPPAEQLRIAFRAAFNADRSAVRTVDQLELTFTPGQLVPLADGKVALISPGRINDGCHGCSGTLAIHYLRPDGSGYRLVGSWLDRAGGSSWGEVGDWSVSDRFANNPTIYSQGGGTWQGTTCSSASLTELKPDEPLQSLRIPIALHEGGGFSDGTEPPAELTGTIANVLRNQRFEVRFSGTETLVETYRYTGGRWVGPGEASKASC